MDGFWSFLAFLAVWFALQAWVLPRFGAPT
jgi:hypothetical protein